MKTWQAMLVFLLLSPSLGSAQDCIDYGADYIHSIGGLVTTGSSQGIAISGNYAYVADGGFGLQVIDISDPNNLEIIGNADCGEAHDVAVSGSYAYVAVHHGMVVVDVSDPENPLIMGSLDTLGSAYSLAVAGDFVYVADGEFGLRVIWIFQPSMPLLMDGAGLPGEAIAVEVSGDFAFVVTNNGQDDSALWILDIASPFQTPSFAGHAEMLGSSRCVAVAGHHAYVGNFYEPDGFRLKIFDFSELPSLVLVGSVETYGMAASVAVANNQAFVAEAGPYRALQVFDINFPADPQLVGVAGLSGTVREVAVSGSCAYVTQGDLMVVDATSPESPQMTGEVDTPGYANKAAISGSYAYMADGDAGLTVIDISVPDSPQIAGGIVTPEYARDVAISGNHAYVGTGTGGLGDPDTGSLLVVDITYPENLQIAGSVETGRASAVTVEGDHAYVTHISGLHILDISNPVSPLIVGSLEAIPGGGGEFLGTTCVELSNGYAFVTGGVGLLVVDVTIPESPQVISQIGEDFWEVAVSGHYAYIADSHGLQVIYFDFLDPDNLQFMGSVDIGFSRNVTVLGDYAYLTGGDPDLQVVDISNPMNPQFVGHVYIPGQARGISISGDNIYLAAGEGGLKIVRQQCDDTVGIDDNFLDPDPEPGETPQPLTRLSIHPNPFNPSTRISFTIDQAQKVDLAVFDLTGKRIAMLADRWFETGEHSLDWDGRDFLGQAVASGTYLLRMVSDEGVASEKMMLIR
jgi:hypothetical protein